MDSQWFMIISAVALAATAAVYLRVGTQYREGAKITAVIAAAMAAIFALGAMVCYGEYSSTLNSAPFWVYFLPQALPMAASVLAAGGVSLYFRAKAKK